MWNVAAGSGRWFSGRSSGAVWAFGGLAIRRLLVTGIYRHTVYRLAIYSLECMARVRRVTRCGSGRFQTAACGSRLQRFTGVRRAASAVAEPVRDRVD
ncbi:hypothetical protein tb265_10740 [Gemmatimonadetes bacterium T265]|nr:hypothetical protein tb265_10740 [Gemmatimonadetes bacterium T265]